MANIYNPNTTNITVSNGASIGGLTGNHGAGTGYTINTGAGIGTGNITVGAVGTSWASTNTQLSLIHI